MNYFVLLAFVLSVLFCNAQSAVEDDKTPFSCTPSEWFMKGCNRCECSESGTWAECRVNLCDPEDKTKQLKAPENCKPRESFYDGCNNCFCAGPGIFACTLQDCSETLGNRPDFKPAQTVNSK